MFKITLLTIALLFSAQGYACPTYDFRNLECTDLFDGQRETFIIDHQKVVKLPNNQYQVTTTAYGETEVFNIPVAQTDEDGIHSAISCIGTTIQVRESVNNLLAISNLVARANGLSMTGESLSITYDNCTPNGNCTNPRIEKVRTDMHCTVK